MSFESLKTFKAQLKQTFDPLRAEFRARSELLKLKQGKRDVHAYAQHIWLLASCITNNPIHEHTLITVFMQGLTDGFVNTHVFRLDLKTLEEAISVAEQDDELAWACLKLKSSCPSTNVASSSVSSSKRNWWVFTGPIVSTYMNTAINVCLWNSRS